MLFLITVALECYPWPEFEHSNVMRHQGVTVGETVVMTCHDGYERDDGEKQAVLECLPDPAWNDTVQDCTRK